MFKTVWSIAQSLLLPARCFSCNRPLMTNKSLCQSCHHSLKILKNYCKSCGESIGHGISCGPCIIKPKPYDRFIGMYEYDGLIKSLLFDYKYNLNLSLSRCFAEILVPIIKNHYQYTSWPNLFIPMPAHPKKIRQRGFNPTLEIAKIIEKSIPSTMNYRMAKRTKLGRPQSSLPLNMRAKNVRNVFEAQPSLPAHIAVFDDVMTSGETMSSLCKCLKRQGIQRLDIWVLARTCR